MTPLSMVTGGNRGIGFAIAEGLLKLGHKVLLVARDEEEAEQAGDFRLPLHDGVLAGAPLWHCRRARLYHGTGVSLSQGLVTDLYFEGGATLN